MFNFSSEQTFVNELKPQLKGGDIYIVKFKGVELEVLEGKKNPGQTYTTAVFKFENEHGHFNHRVFDPGPEGSVRLKRTMPTGHEKESPSANEQFVMFVGQFLTAVQPELLSKLQGKSLGFTDLITTIKKYTDAKINSEYKIKLILDKKGKSQIPFVAAINSDNKVFPSSNFIVPVTGELVFTDFEATQIAKIKAELANYIPTDMTVVVKEDVKSDLPFDIDDNLDLTQI